ncbi:MAG: aminoglycoside phosphotransferase family protein [Ardenticatenales bacterium]
MPTFHQTLLDIHGPSAAAWLADLPSLLADAAARWRLILQPPFAPLTYAYVAPGTRDDGAGGRWPVVLKAAPPGRGLSAERAALAAFDGHGAVDLLDADEGRGLLLLRRVRPGTSLLALVEGGRDDEATRAAAAVMRALQRRDADGPSERLAAVARSVASTALRPTLPFPTVADWAGGFDRLRARFGGGAGPLAERSVAMAEATFAELSASPASMPVLLHGDLHHGNVLASSAHEGIAGGGGDAASSWLAIDPQGVLGERAYEAGALLRNPLGWLLAGGQRRARAISERRVAILAEALAVERRRIASWGAAQAVLSAWWSLEDHGAGWEGVMAVAEVLFGIVSDGPHQATETPRSPTPTSNP